MPWRLRGFELSGDALLVECDLPDIDMDDLRRTFGLAADDPGHDSYLVDEATAHRLGIHPPPGKTWAELAWFVDLDAD